MAHRRSFLPAVFVTFITAIVVAVGWLVYQDMTTRPNYVDVGDQTPLLLRIDPPSPWTSRDGWFEGWGLGLLAGVLVGGVFLVVQSRKRLGED